MTRVLLLGPNGMLGTAIRECAPDDITVVPWLEKFRMRISHDSQITIWPDGLDAIINTIGILPERDPYQDHWMAYVNGTVPHLVALRAMEAGVPVIHVSTDCVYGSHSTVKPQPKYSQLDTSTPDDHYGRTKLAGESEHAINVRTSFVGPRHGLWKWFVDQRRADPKGTVDGWLNAWWSGSTVNAVARALLELARDPGEPRTLHLATETPISKFGLLCELQYQLAGADYALDGAVTSVSEPRIDRSLHPDITLSPFADALRDMVS